MLILSSIIFIKLSTSARLLLKQTKRAQKLIANSPVMYWRAKAVLLRKLAMLSNTMGMNKQLKVMNNKELPKLTRKQQAFVSGIVNNPTLSATEIANQTYQVKSRLVAKSIATENLSKPAIMQHLVANSQRAEQKIVSLIESEKEEIALSASKDILDRVHGKATQRTEVTSTGITLNIDLTGDSGTPDVA